MVLTDIRVGQLVNKGGELFRVAGRATVSSDAKVLSVVHDTAYDVKAVDGIWLLLFLEQSDAETLAVPGGEPADELHLTVGALDSASVVGKQDVINSIIEHAASTLPPVRGKVGGVGQFLTDGQDVPVVALFDSPELNAWRETLLGTLKAIGVELLSDHGYTPHVTLRYADRPIEIDLANVVDREIELPTLSLVWDGDRRNFGLAGTGESIKGGPGSGHHGHSGRPGQRGGSAPGGGGGEYGVARALERPTRVSEKGTLELLEHGIVPEGEGQSLRERLFPGKPQRPSGPMQSEENRAEVKDEIVSTISQQTGISPDKVSGVLKTWAETSKATPESIELQKAAAEEFGLPMREMEPLLESSGDIPKMSRGEMRSVLRAMYNETQRQFKERGIESVVLYRGVRRDADFPEKAGNVIAYKGNPIQSWSTLWDVAFTFGDGRGANQCGIVLAARVPVGMVMSTARTGLGCLSEYEFVVFGDDIGSQALVISQSGAGSMVWEHAGG